MTGFGVQVLTVLIFVVIGGALINQIKSIQGVKTKQRHI